MNVPWRYGTEYRPIEWVEQFLRLEGYHPEYVRRLIAWLEHKAGTVGIGGTWRAGGAQPDRPGFAPEGKSFHQDQAYNDGHVGPCAVDLVVPDGPDANHYHDGITWAMVPAQGSELARTWGLHCNVGTPGQVGSEPWHIQPIEIDGWQTWWNAGRPAPRPNYPIPDQEDDDMTPAPYAWRPKGYTNVFIVIGTDVIHATARTLSKYGLTPADIIDDDHAQTLKSMLHKSGLTESDLER